VLGENGESRNGLPLAPGAFKGKTQTDLMLNLASGMHHRDEDYPEDWVQKTLTKATPKNEA
jgi:hypothetical protein